MIMPSAVNSVQITCNGPARLLDKNGGYMLIFSLAFQTEITTGMGLILPVMPEILPVSTLQLAMKGVRHDKAFL
jgi:hypothetical protein